MEKLEKDFYLNDTLNTAKQLIGKYIVRKIDNADLIMKITETEAYIGSIDKACHAYKNKRTERTEVMFAEGGKTYVYMIYGMYYCLNVVTEKKDVPCAVLIRGGIPHKGFDKMSLFRYNKKYNELNNYQIKNFSNGPGKLCKALNITKEQNFLDLTENEIYICEKKEDKKPKIKIGKRINIDYAEEAKDFLWRFYI